MNDIAFLAASRAANCANTAARHGLASGLGAGRALVLGLCDPMGAVMSRLALAAALVFAATPAATCTDRALLLLVGRVRGGGGA